MSYSVSKGPIPHRVGGGIEGGLRKYLYPLENDKLYLLFQPNVPLVQVIIVHLHTVDPVLITVRSVDVPKLLH